MKEDAPSMGFAFLCFVFPLLGLILFLVWRKDFPQKAKFCGIGALIGVALSVIVLVIRLIQPMEGTTSVKSQREFNYKGLSFIYSGNWRASPEIIEDDRAYSVICKKFGITNIDTIAITWVYDTDDYSIDLIENLMEEYDDMFTKTEFSEFYSSMLGVFECVSTDFILTDTLAPNLSLPFLENNLYGTISSFFDGEYSVVLVKLTNKKSHLHRAEFQLIEDSLDIE